MSAALPINPTIIRIMRVLRIARGRKNTRPHIRSSIVQLLYDDDAAIGLQLWIIFSVSESVPVKSIQ